MLELRSVSKRFSGIAAVDDVSFSAQPGEVTGYLGPNGSGKSTTMKMISGLIEPTSGEIFFEGEPIQRDLIAHKQRMGYVAILNIFGCCARAPTEDKQRRLAVQGTNRVHGNCVPAAGPSKPKQSEQRRIIELHRAPRREDDATESADGSPVGHPRRLTLLRPSCLTMASLLMEAGGR